MKAVLILFEKLSNRQRRGLGHASLKLAEKLLAEGSLEQVICLDLDPQDDIFGDRAQVFTRNRVLRLAYMISARLGHVFPKLKTRRFHEFLFDRFARSRLRCGPDTLLYITRPLFNRTIAQAKANGMKVWIQSSVAHPLLNFSLVRNEELRLGLSAKGPYSDIVRAEKIARTILSADRLITFDPAIGKFTHDSSRIFIDPRRLLPLKNFFTIDPEEFTAVAKERQPRTPGAEIVFFHLSHINLIKGVSFLLEAWRKLQERGLTNCRLVMGGRLDHNVSRLIKEQYADLENVEYRGLVDDLVGEMSRMDVFVSPSISDSGPATLIEAMSAGLPVVASRNCGLTSLISEEVEGFAYHYNDVTRLTDIMAWFMDNPDQIFPMGQRARSRVKDLSTGRYAAELAGYIKAARSDD